MKYTANTTAPHAKDGPLATDPAIDQTVKTGVLIANLGTPEAPTAKALRVYLAEFLSDTRVVEIPRLIWLCILHGIILRTRPAKSAKLYESVWTEDGSPLLVISKQQRDKLQAVINDKHDNVPVVLGMRYGNPSVAQGLQELRDKGVRRIIVMPLYPQYSAPASGAVFDAVASELQTWRWVPELHFMNNYCDHDSYIAALARSVREYIEQHGMPDKFLLSYHGMPQQFLLNGDPYHCFCHKTTRLLKESLDLPAEQLMTVFQSRFGKAQWLQPYLSQTLEQLPEQGIKRIAVISPSFSADCLETLEELEVESRELFMASGGTTYHYIPALNDRDDHIESIYGVVAPYL